MSAYQTAIDQTIRTLERRARYFRNHIVIIVMIGTVIVAAALVNRAPSMLMTGFLLVPICGFFLYADAKALNDWRSNLFATWTTRDIDFAAFRNAILANPALPNGTTEGMLMTLPSLGDLIAEQKILGPTRQAVRATTLTLHHGRADALLLKAVASGIVVGSTLAAYWMHALAPLIGLASVMFCPLIRIYMRRWRQTRCKAEVAIARRQAGFSDSDFASTRAGLL